MEDLVIDSLERTKRYLSSFNDEEIKRIKTSDGELTSTIRLGFIHSLGELALNIDLINESDEMKQEKKSELLAEVSEVMRQIAVTLSNLVD